MRFNPLGNTGIAISALGLGGHEFLADGSARGFHEDFARAVTPGELFEGFGTGKREQVLAAAYEAGINLLDATIDSEKAALGRNLHAMPPPYPLFVQTRPEGMAYNYDLHNRKMADYGLLRAEVRRILGLLGRERIEFFNFPFMASALENDPDYLGKMSRHVAALKEEGLIQFAGADTFSGEATYLRQMETDCFESLFVNFNFADSGAAARVLPAAADRGMGVFAREAFLKGALFRMGAEAGITDRNRLAQVSVKWIWSHPQVTSVVIGIDAPEQLACQMEALRQPELTDADEELLQTLRATPTFQNVSAERRKSFSS